MEYVKTNDTVIFTANFYHPASGYSVAADTTPQYLVYEGTTGAAILNGAMSARTDHTGAYYGSFTASAGNGFDSGTFYDVQVSGTVSGTEGIASVKQFVLDEIFDANTVQVSGEAVTLADLQGSSGGASAADIWTYSNRTLTNLGGVAVSGDVAAAVLASTLANYSTPGTVGHAIVVASGNLISGDWTVIGDLSNLDAAVSSRMPTTHINATGGSVDNVALVDTTTNNTDMRGTDNAALAATALSNATWTDGRAAYLDTIPNLSTKTNLEAVSGVLVARTLVSADYFDPTTDTVAHVTLVDTTTDVTNNVSVDLSTIESKLDENKLYLVAVSGDTVAILADTDELQTNQGNWLTATGFATPEDILSASGAITDQISGLNNFDPAADTVAHVTLVDTTTTNSDMRGTDNAALSTDLMSVSGSIQDTLGSMDQDIYFANVKYVKDSINAQDEFAIQWFKNDQPIGSGDLTNPAISVYNTSTGAAVLEHQLMTYASPNLGVVRHNLAAVMASGEPYLVETSGTIDASVHTWKTVVGIDSL